MEQEMLVAGATASDLAADMENHRATYRRFLSLLKWVAGGSAIALVIVFILMLTPTAQGHGPDRIGGTEQT